MIKKIILTLITSIFISIYFCQNQYFVKNIIQDYIQKIPAFKDTYLDCYISKLDFLSPTIKIHNLIVCDKDRQWHWDCQKIKINFSWLDLILYKKIKAKISLNEWNTHSNIDDQIYIVNHLKKFIGQQQFPIELMEVNLKNCSTTLKNKKTNTCLKAYWSNQSRELNKTIKSSFYFFDGYIKYKNNREIINLNGTMHSVIPLEKNNKKKSASVNLTFHAPLIKAKRCFLTGKICNNEGEFKLTNINGLLIADPLKISNNKINANIRFPLKYCKRFIDKKYYNFFKKSYCKAKLNGNLTTKNFNGKIALYKIGILEKVKLNFNNSKTINGNFQLYFDKLTHSYENLKLQGDFNFKKPDTGTINLYNNDEIYIHNYYIGPKNFNLQTKINTLSTINSQYKILLDQVLKNTQIQGSGTIDYNNKNCNVSGQLSDFNYQGKVDLFPFSIKNFQINENTTPLLEISSKEINKINTNIDYRLIKKLLPNPIEDILEGNGNLNLQGTIDNKGRINGELTLNNGTILLPNLYNAITEFYCKIIIDGKNIKIKNLKAQLYKGEIECNKGKCIIKDLSSEPEFIFLPLKLKDVFFSFKKSITSSISGSLILSKYLNKNKILGNIILNKCNINLDKSQKQKTNITNNNTDIDITIINKQPIKLQTKQLECKTQGYIKLNRIENSNKISGNIQIISGLVKFPYKNLHIIDGRIHLVPSNQLLDISAKGTIKGFNVTVQIEGPIKKPNIILDSSPQLTEEQIGSLLITGSQNTSLNILAPSFLMQNLQNILIDSSNKNSEYIFKPLKHIRLISNLKDQQGSLGLTGGIEIDFNDRLHATIQKDLNTSDETKLELDYQISDDINIRGTKDERGDLSGELEMRWKF